VFTLDPATGRRSPQPLAAVPGYDLHPHFIEGRGRLLGLRYTIDAEITQWLDPQMQQLQAKIDALLPATVNRITPPRQGDAPHVLVQAFSDGQPMIALAFDVRSGKTTRLGSSHPQIQPAQMGRMDFVRIPARDGLEIPAYLTLPPGASGASAKNLPLVVLVHGGPWVRGAEWQWDPEVQFLASRGYAVLQPQFRGSTGFGRRLFEAGWKQWGQGMHTDLVDTTRWAIAQGTVDPRRVCVAGASYGGYATLMALVHSPELFRCGVNWVGVTDIGLMYEVHWSDLSGESKRHGMPTLIGDPVADAAMLKAQSPLQQAQRLRSPLLMAYGAWDVRVPLVHGERLLAALKPHNPDVEWVVYPEEGHGWRKPETERDFWGRVERFLARHIGPAAAPGPAAGNGSRP
jgi:dipeptidyl aminopeptidase/acylaminoacyl peptidase